MDGWNEETWEEEMAAHPFFAKSVDPSKELSPLLKGIQDLKYSADENTPEELAANYKEDGNFQFKLKKYRMAVAAYTEGIKHLMNKGREGKGENDKDKDDLERKDVDDSKKHNGSLLHAQLLTNRAAAQVSPAYSAKQSTWNHVINHVCFQFHLGNYRSSLLDCRLALSKVAGHRKAIVRGVQCGLKLKRCRCRQFGFTASGCSWNSPHS
jgi:hypothetical protein